VVIISLLPSATEIIARLGLAESLVGRSNECTHPPEVLNRPVVTAARIEPRELESIEIDRQVRQAIADGRSLYAVDAALIDRLAPDVIAIRGFSGPTTSSLGRCSNNRTPGGQGDRRSRMEGRRRDQSLPASQHVQGGGRSGCLRPILRA